MTSACTCATNMKLREIAESIGVRSPMSERLSNLEPTGYAIDSRTIRPGELFFAIRGPSFDGHDFAHDALTRGACAAVVSRPIAPSHTSATSPLSPQFLLVNDTLKSLQALARWLRANWGGALVGVTGSAGKTMTKELTARLLGAAGARVLKSIGNYNNAFGLPLSLLQMISAGAQPDEFEYAVLEMGMSGPGELTALCSIALPDIGVVTNVNAVHLEFFPDIDAIAEAKAELIEGINPDGLAVLNADDPRVARMAQRRKIEVKTFGIERPAAVTASGVHLEGLRGTQFTLATPRGSVRIETPLAGKHSVYNILAASTVADHYGVPLEWIAESLRGARHFLHRGELHEFPEGFAVLDDSYNSNPAALMEMISTLTSSTGYRRRIVVAGEMLELGDRAAELHGECGRRIAGSSIDLLVGVQGHARDLVASARDAGMPAASTQFCETPEEAAHWLFDKLRRGDLVLIKGSRGVRTEKVLIELKQRLKTGMS
ncbi:MAG: UDP-N-acetylmuramoyl-tripeptide--D-alanyl-D-alanine ligase [Acidobacteria bacterium]|nr:UDP-N-acetylmuramoyl-tripeptide--D-alanyl-D-alanine ligase [Acidobacteriota bacterium]